MTFSFVFDDFFVILQRYCYLPMIKQLWNLFRTKFHYHLTMEEKARMAGVTIGTHNMVTSAFWKPSEPYLIEIGSHCQITDGVKIYTHGGAGAVRYINPRFDVFGKVVLGDYVYVGSNSISVPGVRIGSHVLIAAGSVVTKSIPDNVVIGGNPAKFICTIEEFFQKNEQFNLNTKGLSLKEKKEVLLKTPEEKFVTKGFIKISH